MKKMSTGCRGAERRILSLLHGQETRTQLPQIHAHFLRHHLHQSNQVLAHFVSICGSLHKMPYARLIFSQAQNPNLPLFNSMIKGYSRSGPFDESCCLFASMKLRGISPDEYTFAPLLKSCANLSGPRFGEAVHKEIVANGFGWFGSIQIGIVELYAAFERMGDAKKVFDEIPQRQVILWNLMVHGFCKKGDIDMGLHLFRQMSERNAISWNNMISCLAKGGRCKEALRLFLDMRECGFELDQATVVSVLPICARLGAIDVGRWVHSYADSRGLFQKFVHVGNALVDFYCKCGMTDTAAQIFKKMTHKNVITWNSMVSGLALNGEGELGVSLFDEMMSRAQKPNHASFVGVLSCCVHAGMVERGQELFASMALAHHLEPQIEHYGCMVDLLGRSGRVEEAHGIIRNMPMKPNPALWGSLLSACRTHGYAGLAERAVKELIDLEPSNSGNYVLLSNLYAEEGEWDQVEKMRVLMRERSVTISHGSSTVR